MAQIKAPGPNLLERAIATVAPRAALRRYAARQSIEALRKYEAAESSRLRPENRSKGSADNVNRRAVEVLRERARFMDENFDIASGALDVLESKIVGAGIRTHPMVRASNGSELARDLNARLADLWEEWTHRPEVAREINWAKAQRLLCRSWLRDGEGVTLLMDGLIDGLEHATSVPFSIDLLEGDYIPVTAIERIDDNRELAHGIIRDRWGRPTQYLVYTSHPGSTRLHMLSSLGGGIPSSLIRSDTKEVAASDVLHLKHTKRIRQSRGISIMATVFNRLEDLKDYEESERVAARIGAYVALAIHKSLDAQPNASSSTAPRELDWMPGMIFDQLGPGETVESIENKRPSNQIESFRQVTLRAVAAGMRTGYSSVARHYDNSYSAQRQELVENEAHYHLATEEFVSTVCRPIWRRFVRAAMLSGQIPARSLRGVSQATVYNAAFRGPGVAYIDPLKEMNADKAAVRAGFTSRRSIILKRGGNPAEVEAELAEERTHEAETGLVLDSNAANDKAPTLQMQGAAEGEDDDEDQDEDQAQTEDGDRDADPTVLVGRRGRRGRRGPAPDHEWDEDGTRVRFRNADGSWGPWSSDLGQ